MRTISFNMIRKNSALYLHNAFVCFIWFSENTVIISLHNINRMVFTVQTLYSL